MFRILRKFRLRMMLSSIIHAVQKWAEMALFNTEFNFRDFSIDKVFGSIKEANGVVAIIKKEYLFPIFVLARHGELFRHIAENDD